MATGKVVGDVVQYRLDTPIASGAFSTVWRCTELSSGQTYAMKIVEKRVAVRNKMTGALIREVNALEIGGSSPYVTGLVDKMVSKHNYYIVMDLAEGGTLLDMIRERRQELKQAQVSLPSGRSLLDSLQLSSTPFMPYDRVRHYFKQLLLALSTLHDRNVVHRDVKPENILLNKRRTRLVLSDFGFACHCMPGVKLHRACGTLKYCAPELLREYPSYDGRKIDVWAAGVTLYVMLFGGFPYRCPRGDPDSLLEVIETTTYRIPRPIPAGIEDILQCMLCVDSDQRWSMKQLLNHPWMSGLELNSPPSRASAGEGLTSPTTTMPNTAEAITEMLSEGCSPMDSFPFDEDDVDDGFYQSIHHEQLNSSVSSDCHNSTTPRQKPRQRPLHADSGASQGDVVSLSSPTSLLHSGESETRSASAAFALLTPPSQLLRTSTKQEILQHGTEFTSMASIESSVASDDEREEDEEEEDDSEDDTHHWDEMDEGAVATDHIRSASKGDNLSKDAPCASDAQLCELWGRYSYGLWLTARIAAHLVAFIAVCFVAVALRVLLKCDIIDLPLPEGMRDYISFVLSTPLRRPRAHLSDAALTLSQSPGGSSTASPLALLQKDSHGGSRAHCRLMAPPIPGSGLRHYVRRADKLMRDSFMGSVVLSHNIPLVDLAHRKMAAPYPQELSVDHSLSSTPAAPSLATMAPSQSSAVRQPRERDEAATTEARAESVEGAVLSMPPSAEKSKRNANRPGPPASGDEGSGKEERDWEERDSSLRKKCRRTQSPRPPLVLVEDPISVTTAATTCLDTTANPKTSLRSEAHVDSQAGATDDTGSGDSALDKPAYLPHHNFMFSPISPMPMVPGDHQRGVEDFPIVTKMGHA
nr:unnamed protein product [Leishmania braziliensis]